MDANERKFKNRLIRVYSCAFAVGEILAKKTRYSSTSSERLAKSGEDERELVPTAFAGRAGSGRSDVESGQ
jgi:hypothetical protein